ncbi:MAG: DNA double-strand break repair nuclease NurA [Candidatus Omnitrophota bacterium]
MLSWIDIQKQIERYIERRAQREEEFHRALQKSLQLFRGELSENWIYWRERAANGAYPFLVPGFDEPPACAHPVDPAPSPAILLASDGSQIFPSRHEIAPVALINVSRIRIDYKNFENPPLMESRSSLLLREDFDGLADSEREISFTDLISDKRTLDEMSALADMAEEARSRVVRESQTPLLALTDGSLILWRLAGREFQSYERKIIKRYTESMARLQKADIPLAGYISQPASREAANLLRMIREERCSAETGSEPEPMLTDAVLFSHLLKEGQRSVLFHSRSKILNEYGEQRISSFYLNTGSEIARIEIPQWTAAHREWVDGCAAQCLFQSRLGGGYPIILSEAHECAVVRSADREAFYALLERNLVGQKMRVRYSAKELRKRASIL